MRSDKELLEILLKSVEEAVALNGLCGVILEIMNIEGYPRMEGEIITEREGRRLHSLINRHVPINERTKREVVMFWWKPGEKHYRTSFLNELIKIY